MLRSRELLKKQMTVMLDYDNYKNLLNMIEELQESEECEKKEYSKNKIVNVLLRSAFGVYFCHEQL